MIRDNLQNFLTQKFFLLFDNHPQFLLSPWKVSVYLSQDQTTPIFLEVSPPYFTSAWIFIETKSLFHWGIFPNQN